MFKFIYKLTCFQQHYRKIIYLIFQKFQELPKLLNNIIVNESQWKHLDTEASVQPFFKFYEKS